MPALGARVTSQVMFGREEPLRVLEATLGDAAEGRPRLALVAGEAGVGKTRLLQALETAARGRGFAVLHGECIEFGGEQLPYAPITAALRTLPPEWLSDAVGDMPAQAREWLTNLLPYAASTATPATAGNASGLLGQARLYEAVLELVARLARERAALLLALEDLHWADRSTLALLTFLARNLGAERITVVATYRAEESPAQTPLPPLVAELRRRPNVVALALGPLGPDDAARQLETIAGRPLSATLVGELHARSGGNPFFLEELYAARADAASGAVPKSLADAVLLRVGRLDEAAGRLLALVAAAGGRISFELLERLVAPAELPAAFRSAVDAGILVREADDRGVCFRHALMGEVIYDELLPPERAKLHRGIAEALLATAGAPASQLAVQWYRAGAFEDVLAASVTAGLEAAQLYAFSEARTHLERSLELWDTVGRAPPALGIDKAELLSRAAQAARFTGDQSRAVELALAAVGEVDPAREPVRAALLYERLGEHHFWDDERALEYYGRALALLPRDAGAERTRLLAAEGHALMGLRRLAEARERCEAALGMAADAGATALEAQARTTLGVVLGFLGDGATGEAHLRRALELSQAAAPGEATARAYLHLGEVLRLRGDHAAALEAMVEGAGAAERLGMRESFGHFMYVNAIDDLLRLGRWDDAEARIAGAERMALSLTAAALRHASAAHLYALRGEAVEARSHLDHAARLAANGLPSEFVAPLQVAAATLSLAEGDPDTARRCVDDGIAVAADALYTPPLLWLGTHAEADIAAAQPRASAPQRGRRGSSAGRHAARPARRGHRQRGRDERSSRRPRIPLARRRRARTGARRRAAGSLERRRPGLGRARGAVPRRVRALPRRGGDARGRRRPRRRRPPAGGGAAGDRGAARPSAARGGRRARPRGPLGLPAGRSRRHRSAGRRARTHAARGRRPPPAGRRAYQPRDRPPPLHQPEDGGHARRARLRQARRPLARGSRRARAAPRPAESHALTPPRWGRGDPCGGRGRDLGLLSGGPCSRDREGIGVIGTPGTKEGSMPTTLNPCRRLFAVVGVVFAFLAAAAPVAGTGSAASVDLAQTHARASQTHA